MNATDSKVLEAYVIEDDGTKTSVPVGFADTKPRARYSAASGGRRAYAYATTATGYAAQNPFSKTVATETPRRRLHLGRRLAGIGIAIIGVPLLILPGPGLALIGLGLLMAVMP